MAIVHPDILEEISCEEQDGSIIGMKRILKITGIDVAAITDYQILNTALALEDVPEAGDIPVGMENLQLSKRIAKVVPGDTRTVEIGLSYTPRGTSESNFTLRFGAALTQSTTEVKNGEPLTLQHTWPEDDPDEDRQGRTDDQAGVMNIMDPTLEAIATGIVAVDYPLAILHRWRGALNSRAWAGGAAGLWMCTEAKAFPYDLSTTPYKWKFTFELAYSPYGYQPRISFVDDRTGKPAFGLVEDVGTKIVVYYPSRDFNEILPL